MSWYDDPSQWPSMQLANGRTVQQVLASIPSVPDTSIASRPNTTRSTTSTSSGSAASAAFSPAYSGLGSYDYYNHGLAALLAQMQGQYLSNDQFYANLQFQRDQANRLAEQWAEEFGLSRDQAIADMLLRQHLATGYVQTSPYLTAAGVNMPAWADVYQTIWNQRPDLARFYDAHWGAGRYNIADAVSDWLRMTNEEDVLRANRDAVAYATAMGWYDPAAAQEAYRQGMQKTWEREAGEQQLALNYLTLLASLRGPRDWLAYARTVQGAGQTQLPVWAEALINNTALPSFGNYAPFRPEQLGDVPNQGGNANGSGANAYEAAAASVGNIRPHQIHPAQWNSLSPAFRDMLLAAVEEQGGYAPDFVQWMQNAWPTVSRVNATTYWG